MNQENLNMLSAYTPFPIDIKYYWLAKRLNWLFSPFIFEQKKTASQFLSLFSLYTS
jgi:hypothetical protein